MENPNVAGMSELKETTIPAGPGANYTNVTMATMTKYIQNNGLEKLTETTISVNFFSNDTMIGQVLVKTYRYWFDYVVKEMDSTSTSLTEILLFIWSC